MDLVVTMLIGLGIGVIVELILPRHTWSELILVALLGTAGALLARYVGQMAGWFGTEEPASFVASAFGALLWLVIYGVAFRKPRIRASVRPAK